MPNPKPPDLHTRCSRHFDYADLIQCGATWHSLANVTPAPAPISPDNVPRETATWVGIAKLATEILDPLVDRFGAVQLTYGFAGPALTRHIKRRIYPRLDQHAGSERNRRGALICERLGQACDLIIPGTDSLTVAKFIVTELPFDRLYLYGADRPLHVSVGPNNSRVVVEMRPGPSGRLIPRAFTRDAWLSAIQVNPGADPR